jgi:Ca2+-binding RTX toxin-like protein
MIRRLHTYLVPLLVAGAVLAPAAQAQSSKHKHWPRINGELWINKQDRDTSHTGTTKNDELLGGHGDDTLIGGRGADVIWGDHKARGNTARQRDTIDSGPGNDWVYGSHGRNTIQGGPGFDRIRVWFGRGFVDCGPGRDILYVSRKSDPKVDRRNCETISHKSARQIGDG